MTGEALSSEEVGELPEATRREHLGAVRELVLLEELRRSIEGLADSPFFFDCPRDLGALLEQSLRLQLRSEELRRGDGRVVAAVVGAFNAGKSSFINSLLGHAVCPVEACPTTSSITCFRYGEQPLIRILEPDGACRTIDESEYARLVRHPATREDRRRLAFEYFYPFDQLRSIDLYDTPGFGNPQNPFDAEVTEKATRQADFLFLLIDIEDGEIRRDMLRMLEKMRQTSCAEAWLVVHKADLKNPPRRRTKILQQLQQKYGAIFSGYLLYSSRGTEPDAEAEAANELRTLTNRALARIQQREFFSEQLYGEPRAEGFRLVLGGWKCDLDASGAQNLSRRVDVLRLLSDLQRRKNKLASDALDRDRHVYERDRRRILEAINRELRNRGDDNGTRPADGIDPTADMVDRSIRQVMERIAQALRGVSPAAAQAGWVAESVDKQEKSYVLKPWFKPQFHREHAQRLLEENLCWQEIEQAIRALQRMLAALCREGELSEELDIEALKSHSIEGVLRQIMHAGKIVPSYFKNEEDARQQIKNMIEQLDDKALVAQLAEPFRLHLEAKKSATLILIGRQRGACEGERMHIRTVLEQVNRMRREGGLH